MSSSSPNRFVSPSAGNSAHEQMTAGSAPFQPLPAAEIEKLLKLRSNAQRSEDELGPGDVQYLRGGSVRPVGNPSADTGSPSVSDEVGSAPNIKPKHAPDAAASLGQQAQVSMADFDRTRTESASSQLAAAQGLSLDDLCDLELDISIELGRAELLIEDVLKLREGSVVSLDKLAGDPVDIVANGRLVARGELLVVDGKFGVRLSEVI